MKRIILLPLFLICGCYYGGSTVECESLLNTNRYVCKIDTQNADICFNVIFNDEMKENVCIDDNDTNDFFTFNKKTINSSTVLKTEITSESYSSNSFFLIVFLTCFFWFILICFSIVIAFEDQAMKKRHYTITLLFVCLFNFIGLGILYLIDKTREEIRDRNTKK